MPDEPPSILPRGTIIRPSLKPSPACPASAVYIQSVTGSSGATRTPPASPRPPAADRPPRSAPLGNPDPPTAAPRSPRPRNPRRPPRSRIYRSRADPNRFGRVNGGKNNDPIRDATQPDVDYRFGCKAIVGVAAEDRVRPFRTGAAGAVWGVFPARREWVTRVAGPVARAFALGGVTVEHASAFAVSVTQRRRGVSWRG